MKTKIFNFLVAITCLTQNNCYGDTYNFNFGSKPSKTEPDKVVEIERESVPPTKAPETPPPASAPPPVNATEATVTHRNPKSNFFIHVGGIYMPEEWSVRNSDLKKETLGGLLGIDLELNSRWTLGAYLGIRHSKLTSTNQAFYGMEAEFKLIQLGLNSDFRTIEIGPVLGMSTLNAPEVLALYGGARAHLNFSESFGLIGTARFNLGYSQFEAGFLARL